MNIPRHPFGGTVLLWSAASGTVATLCLRKDRLESKMQHVLNVQSVSEVKGYIVTLIFPSIEEKSMKGGSLGAKPSPKAAARLLSIIVASWN